MYALVASEAKSNRLFLRRTVRMHSPDGAGQNPGDFKGTLTRGQVGGGGENG